MKTTIIANLVQLKQQSDFMLKDGGDKNMCVEQHVDINEMKIEAGLLFIGK